MKRSLFSAVAVLAAAAAGCSEDRVIDPPAPPPPPPPAFMYEALDLATPDGSNSFPAAIDAGGRVHLFLDQADGRHLFRWDNGTLADAGVLPGPAQGVFTSGSLVAGALLVDGCVEPCRQFDAVYLLDDGALIELAVAPPASRVFVRMVNEAGAVLAQVDERAMLWQNGAPILLDSAAEAGGMNQSGLAVGTSFGATAQGQAVVWDNGMTQALANLPGGMSASAAAINSLGDVAGTASDATGARHAVVWRARGEPAAIEVNTPESFAIAMNDDGDVLIGAPNGARWLWDGSLAHPIALGQRVTVNGLNGLGEVFGAYVPAGTDQPHAFVWRDGQLHDLGTGERGGISAMVTASNARGDLAGLYVTAEGNTRSMVWRRLN